MSRDLDAASARRWKAAGRAALEHMLTLIAASPWQDNVWLRGDVPMRAWYGGDALEPRGLDVLLVPDEHGFGVPLPCGSPGDMVWQWPETVTGMARWLDGTPLHTTEAANYEYSTPSCWLVDDPCDAGDWELESLCEGVVDAVRRRPTAVAGVVLDADDASVTWEWPHYWTTDEFAANEVELAIPWRADGLPPGAVRIALAYGYNIPFGPALVLVPRRRGRRDPVLVQAASRELMLARRLLAMQDASDIWNEIEARDLYEAVLLAEDDQTLLTPDLLEKVYDSLHLAPKQMGPRSPAHWRVEDWEGFRAANPQVRGAAGEWLDRLARALERNFTVGAPPELDPDLRAGHVVTVTDGPFKGNSVTLTTLDWAPGKVRATAFVFGREVSIELRIGQFARQ